MMGTSGETLRAPMFGVVGALALAFVLFPAGALAQEGDDEDEGDGEAAAAPDPEREAAARAYASIRWLEAPQKGALGSLADLTLPEKYHFTGVDGTKTMMHLTHNPVSGKELGFVEPEDGEWFVVFEFSDVGYVKDDEKDKLDEKAILASLREGNEAGNEERVQSGWGKLEIVGWEQAPRYDTKSHNLEWAVRVRGDHGDSINYNTRILGRGGVMEAALVVDPDKLQTTLPAFKALLEGYDFRPEERYSSYRAGDKMAEYGLTALVTGGAVAVAAKSGLLAKLGKGAIKLIALAVAGLVALAKKLFGKKAD